jgi:seryl-tRNA synthetase
MALTTTRTLHEIRVTFLPDGSIESRVQTDLVLIKDSDTELKRSLEAVALDEVQMTALLGEQFAGVAAQVTSLTAERDAADEQITALTAERDTLKTERDAAISQAQTLASEKTTVIAERDAAKAQIIDLLGTPKFLPSALAAEFTEADLVAIRTVVTGSVDLWDLYNQLLLRAATGDAPIPISSPTFLAGLAGLQSALGEPRVAELFAALNVDLVAGRYIQPIAA